MLNTNLCGVIRVTKGVLPTLRSQRSGIIINMSSVNGLAALPGIALYSATKFALEGLSEALQMEIAPFHIRVVLLEPGLFETPVVAKAMTEYEGKEVSEPYRGGAVDPIVALGEGLASGAVKWAGDPTKLGKMVVDIVAEFEGREKEEIKGVERVVMGKDAVAAVEEKMKRFMEMFERRRGANEKMGYDD